MNIRKNADILDWVDREMAKNRNDTVHDFLAYLAGQMIEMNRKKNEEIRGFLKWLEREIGCNIDDLVGKTVLKDYHEGDIVALLAILKKNKTKISIDPTSRKVQELIEGHFDESMAVLVPLKEKIEATDNLIDRIVYRLYALTTEEIGIVEGTDRV
jgi:hypothetical protein